MTLDLNVDCDSSLWLIEYQYRRGVGSDSVKTVPGVQKQGADTFENANIQEDLARTIKTHEY